MTARPRAQRDKSSADAAICQEAHEIAHSGDGSPERAAICHFEQVRGRGDRRDPASGRAAARSHPPIPAAGRRHGPRRAVPSPSHGLAAGHVPLGLSSGRRRRDSPGTDHGGGALLPWLCGRVRCRCRGAVADAGFDAATEGSSGGPRPAALPRATARNQGSGSIARSPSLARTSACATASRSPRRPARCSTSQGASTSSSSRPRC